MKAIVISRKRTCFLSLNAISPKARRRTVTVSACVPVLPPMEATIGISTASATSFSIVASKSPMIVELTIAVHKFTASHTARARPALKIVVSSSSASSSTPARL